MAADARLEVLLADVLHAELDAATGPHPRWADAPAARRVAGSDSRPGCPVLHRRTGRGTTASEPILRLSLATVATVVLAAALGAAVLPRFGAGEAGDQVVGSFSYGTVPDLPPPIVAGDDGSVWLRDGAGDAVRFDPATYQLTRVVPMGPGTGAITSGAGSIWATGAEGGQVIVRRLDPASGRTLETRPYHLGDVSADSIAVAADQVWVHQAGQDMISMLTADGTQDAGTSGLPIRDIRYLLGTGTAPQSASVWADFEDSPFLIRVPIDGPRLSSAVTFEGCGGVRFAADQAGVWTVCGTDLVYLDLVTRDRIATLTLPADLVARPHAIAIGGGWLWVAAGSETFLQLDPATGGVLARTLLDGPGWPAFAGGRLVVAAGDGTVSVVTPR